MTDLDDLLHSIRGGDDSKSELKAVIVRDGRVAVGRKKRPAPSDLAEFFISMANVDRTPFAHSDGEGLSGHCPDLVGDGSTMGFTDYPVPRSSGRHQTVESGHGPQAHKRGEPSFP